MPEVDEARPARGVQYVYGSPAQKPILRPLRRPLYDSEEIAVATTRVIFFNNTATFASGAAKNITDTNMTTPRQLGSPTEFDLIGFVGELERGVPVADIRLIYNGAAFQWFFGNVEWLTLKLTKLAEGNGEHGAAATTVAATTIQFFSNGWPAVNNFTNFTTPDRRARRITSTESFRGEFQIPVALAGLAATRQFTIFMLGVMYAQL